jgi:phosphoglycerate dehydrogenase-like enzyme
VTVTGPINIVVGTALVPRHVADWLAAQAPDAVAVDYLPAPWQDELNPLEIPEEWAGPVARAHVFVGFPEVLRGLVPAAPEMRWVQYYGAGYDRAPLDELRQAGVGLVSAAGAGAAGVAEFAVMAMLSLARRAPERYAAQGRREWQRFPSREVAGRRVTVVGAGAIGSRLCRLTDALDMEVTCVRRRPGAGCPPGARRVLGPADLSAVLPETDVLILAAALTAETEPLGLDDFARLPEAALLVNVARGGLIDHEGLLAAMPAGRPAAAWLDTPPVEPLPGDHPLWTAPNVVISAHDATASQSYAANVAALTLVHLRQWLAGEEMTNLVLPPRPPPGR